MRHVLLVILIGLALFVGGHFSRGVYGYVTGTATLEYVGYPGFGNGNLDPRSRAPWGTTGCMSFGLEPITQGANNFAIQVMGSSFGPMPGAYDGPIPTKLEARELLASEGTRFDPWIADPTHPLFLDGSALPESALYTLHDGLRVVGVDPDAPPSRFMLFEERALLVGSYDDFGDVCRIAVLDAADYDTRPVARYLFGCRR